MQDDEEGHGTALAIIQDLMVKGQDEFLDHFGRFGVFNMVHSMVGDVSEDDELLTEETKKVAVKSQHARDDG